MCWDNAHPLDNCRTWPPFLWWDVLPPRSHSINYSSRWTFMSFTWEIRYTNPITNSAPNPNWGLRALCRASVNICWKSSTVLVIIQYKQCMSLYQGILRAQACSRLNLSCTSVHGIKHFLVPLSSAKAWASPNESTLLSQHSELALLVNDRNRDQHKLGIQVSK